MQTLPIGFILTVAVVFFSMEQNSWALYFNAHALVMVLGGTVTILIMATPGATLKNLWIATRDILRPVQNVGQLHLAFKDLQRNRALSTPTRNPLISYAAELWAQGIEPDLFIVLLAQKRDELERGYIDAVQALRNLAKYPPALGMTGTVMGLVSLFSVLGTGDRAALGPSLALAMTATFFGLIVANCAVTPFADHLHVKHMQNEKLYTSVYQILILINRGEAPALVDEEVKGRAAN